MRFLILNTDYPDFLHLLYGKHPNLEMQSYDEQLRVRMESLFGMADFYSRNLRKLGHESFDVIANAEWIQKSWAREHGVLIEESSQAGRSAISILQPFRKLLARTPLRHLKTFLKSVLSLLDNQEAWYYQILEAQIEFYKPDVLLNLAMDTIPTSFLQDVRKNVRLLIGSASPPVLLNKQDWRVYDLAVAPSEYMVDYLLNDGMKAELLRLGFESSVFSSLNRNSPRSLPVSFVGSLGRIHSERLELLETLCLTLGDNIYVWAPSVDHLPQESSIRKRYQGSAFGLDSYRILSTSKITVNSHLNVAGQFADNMRLFEATGVGTLLITDWKVNMHSIFELGKEVVTYRTSKECAELIQYYLEHDEERETIARAGQERTLREHTYYKRMQELVNIVNKYL